MKTKNLEVEMPVAGFIGKTEVATRLNRSLKTVNDGMGLGTTPARSAGGGPLPCLLLTTAPEREKINGEDQKNPLGRHSAIARKADTLRRNLQDLIDRAGIDRIGFMTLTFPWVILCRQEAEKRFHSFQTHVLSQLVDEYIAVPERQENGSLHYHLATAFPFDIRSGFDFVSCSAANLIKRNSYLGNGKWAPGTKQEFDALEREVFASANGNLKRVWRVIREVNDPRKKGRKPFGFGRCQTFPVLSNADGIAYYIGTYISTQMERRAPEDKGMRSVRYSLKIRRYYQSFQFVKGGNGKWRAGCKVLGKLLLIHDEPVATREGKKLVFHYPPDHVRSRFGPRWPHRLARWVFVCYERSADCLIFARKLPPEMPWRNRLLAVSRFLNRLKGNLSLPEGGLFEVESL